MMPQAVYWFTFGDYEMLNLVIRTMTELRIRELRTAFSWADWEREGGKEWLDHVVGKTKNAGITLVPCLFYTPPHKARRARGAEPKTSFPPVRLMDYADFAEEMIGRYGYAFEWIQFWNEANWNVYWNWEMDPGWKLFAEMVGYAIPVARDGGKKIVLGGLSPYDAEWVDAMFSYGIMQAADALGIHAFPGTWDAQGPRMKGRTWRGLAAEVETAREQLRAHGSHAEVWLTETGYSTYGEGDFKRARELGQVAYFDELLGCNADRIFWHTIVDQHPDAPTDNELTAGLPRDKKAYHFGVVDRAGIPKPLYFHWRDMLT